LNANHHDHILPGPENLDQFEHVYLKQARSWASPDVVELRAADGARFVMKDWSRRPLIFRLTWCRIAAGREIGVYEKLRGMQGVPQLISRLGKLGFVMEWLDARPLPSRKMKDLLSPEFFDHLDEVVDEMHNRGVAHGDLRRRNILRGLDGQPKLIDFETAVSTAHIHQPGKIFREACKIDKITVTKIRARYFPESLSEAKQALLDDVPWHLSWGRFMRRELYAPLTRKGRRRRMKSKS